MLVVCAVAAATAAWAARASDHADTAENVNRISVDLTDLYVFPSPQNPRNVVFVMNARGLIPSGQSASFDPRALYQFKIDNTGDFVEDLVIQARFSGVGSNQRVLISGPSRPFLTGTTTLFGRRHPGIGRVNTVFFPKRGMMAFAGLREDSFFFDLEQFYTIFPDRKTPLTGRQVDLPNPNEPQALSWRAPGVANDFLAGFNVLSIVVEMPRTWLAPKGGKLGKIGVWMTTSVQGRGRDGFKFRQQERLARPVVNEVLATVTNRRHEVNNKNNPTDDSRQLAKDIESFLTFPANRSREIKDVLKAVLVPDVMVADLKSRDPASYLGVETGGFTGGKFGGRALADDVVDISLYAVFGTAVSDLGLASPDGSDIPSLTSDSVGPGAKQFRGTFPYMGDPR